VRNAIRLKHYSLHTERAYVGWIRRFILFHDKRHPMAMGAAEVTAFLSHLAVEGKVASSTQNQALVALLFLYRRMLARRKGHAQKGLIRKGSRSNPDTDRHRRGQVYLISIRPAEFPSHSSPSLRKAPYLVGHRSAL
jgi:hypothetical protein